MLDRPPAIIHKLPLGTRRSAGSPAGPPRLGPPEPELGGRRERHPIARPAAIQVRRRDEMGPGLVISAVLHTLVFVLIMLGLPDLWTHKAVPEPGIVVSIVKPSDVTRTTAPNPHPDRAGKLVEPTPVPVPKPLPPVKIPIPPIQAPPPESTQAPPPPEPLPKPPEPKPPEPRPVPPPPPPQPVEPKPAPPPPEPKPVPPPPKVEPPKPPPPKPTPVKPVAKPEPQKPQKQPDIFDDLLKNLTKNPVQPKSDQPQKPLRQPPQTQQASSLPNAPLGSEISTSEKEMIAAAVNPCFDADKGAPGASSLRASIQFDVAPDGTVTGTKILSVEGGASEAVRRAFAERAARSPLQPECNKLPIPAGKYDELKDLIMNFTIEGAL